MKKTKNVHIKENTFQAKLKVNLHAMKSLFKLVNASYWQSVFGPVMAFAFPVLFVGLYGYIMKASFGAQSQGQEEVQFSLLKSALVGMVAMMGMSFAINQVPQWINDFKQSVLLKRIGTTPIKPVTFLITVFAYAIIIMTVQVFWMLTWICIWFAKDIVKILESLIKWGPEADDVYGGIQWGSFIFSIFYTLCTAIFIGLLIVSISRSALGSNVIGMIIFFLSQFLSGQVFPIQYIVQNPTLNAISHFTPFRYTTGIITMSWDGANIFNFTKPFMMYIGDVEGELKSITIYPVYDLVLNMFMPLVFILLSVYASAKNFKWNVR